MGHAHASAQLRFLSHLIRFVRSKSQGAAFGIAGEVQMQTKLLIACEDESRDLCLSERIAQVPESGIAVFTTDLRKLGADVASIQPDVLLIEHSPLRHQLPEMLPPLLRSHIAPKVLFLCDSCTRELMLAFVRCGACGCVLTSDHPALVAKAVRSVHEGDTWFGRTSLVLALRSLVGTPPRIAQRVDDGRLTAREEEIFDLIGLGLTNKEIARQLDISDHTVKTHLHRIYVKLQLSGRYKALLSQPGKLAH
jgi:DNA-binding NarL/FixJ family response regulator